MGNAAEPIGQRGEALTSTSSPITEPPSPISLAEAVKQKVYGPVASACLGYVTALRGTSSHKKQGRAAVRERPSQAGTQTTVGTITSLPVETATFSFVSTFAGVDAVGRASSHTACATKLTEATTT